VAVPAGKYTVALRYRPADVLLGGLLGLVGVAIAGYWWCNPRRLPRIATG
jgi:hypothetical protein